MAIRDRGRRFRKLGQIALVMIVLSLLTFALPVSTWRTGQPPATPLEIVNRGPAGSVPRHIWIDTDAACGRRPEHAVAGAARTLRSGATSSLGAAHNAGGARAASRARRWLAYWEDATQR